MNGYDLSRSWFDFAFENPERINPAHSAIYFFAIEHCNRMGWKSKFGFPSQMAMDAVGIRKHETYIKYFNDLCDWGFFLMVERSRNQYSANIISLDSALPKNGEALGKAIRKHGGKQPDTTGESNSGSTGESIGGIDKPLTNNLKPLNQEQEGTHAPDVSRIQFVTEEKKEGAGRGSFNPPEVEEVKRCFMAAMGSLGLPPDAFGGAESMATDLHNYYTSQGWRKANGLSVTEWRPLIPPWIAKEKSNAARATRQNNQSTAKPERSWNQNQ